MEDTRIQDLKNLASTAELFTYLFFTRPDEDFVHRVLHLGSDVDASQEDAFSEDVEVTNGEDYASTGLALMSAFAKVNAGRPIAEVLQDIAVDRTRLFGGLTPKGPRPPYESLFIGRPQGGEDGTVLSVKASYRECGFHVNEKIKEVPDHLGFEMALTGALAMKEVEALEAGDETLVEEVRNQAHRFLSMHMGNWGILEGDEILKFAATDFFRGVAYLVKSFVEQSCRLYDVEPNIGSDQAVEK